LLALIASPVIVAQIRSTCLLRVSASHLCIICRGSCRFRQYRASWVGYLRVRMNTIGMVFVASLAA